MTCDCGRCPFCGEPKSPPKPPPTDTDWIEMEDIGDEDWTRRAIWATAVLLVFAFLLWAVMVA